jgi:hypothetical protein
MYNTPDSLLHVRHFADAQESLHKPPHTSLRGVLSACMALNTLLHDMLMLPPVRSALCSR